MRHGPSLRSPKPSGPLGTLPPFLPVFNFAYTINPNSGCQISYKLVTSLVLCSGNSIPSSDFCASIDPKVTSLVHLMFGTLVLNHRSQCARVASSESGVDFDADLFSAEALDVWLAADEHNVRFELSKSKGTETCFPF